MFNSHSGPVWPINVAAKHSGTAEHGFMALDFPALNRRHV